MISRTSLGNINDCNQKHRRYLHKAGAIANTIYKTGFMSTIQNMMMLQVVDVVTPKCLMT